MYVCVFSGQDVQTSPQMALQASPTEVIYDQGSASGPDLHMRSASGPDLHMEDIHVSEDYSKYPTMYHSNHTEVST